jgi:hypothetical protein
VAEQGRQLSPVLVGRLVIRVPTAETVDQNAERSPFVLVSDLSEAAAR